MLKARFGLKQNTKGSVHFTHKPLSEGSNTKSYKRQGRCLAAASVESGDRLLAVASAAAGQVGTQADHSCLPLLLACKALRYQLARPG